MFNLIKKSALSTFSPAGARGKLSVLIFHRVLQETDELFPNIPNEDQFSDLLLILKNNFNVLKLSHAIDLLKKESLPSRSVCITFDDGYMDNYTIAKPILEKYELPATFFISTGFLDGTCMWNDILIEAVRRTNSPYLECSELIDGSLKYSLQGLDDKKIAILELISHLKYIPLKEREGLVLKINDKLKVDVMQNLMMTSSEVKGMANSSMEIGAHTVNHPILSKLDLRTARNEIADGRDTLESIAGEKVSLFAYPNGKLGEDYNYEHRELCRKLGFKAAVSTVWGAANKYTDLFQLPRFTPWEKTETKFVMQMMRNLVTKVPQS